MKITAKYILFMVLCITLALALTAFSSPGANPLQGPECGNLVLGGTCTLGEGDKLNDDLLVMGGSATLEAGSTVAGDVVVLGGSLDVNGTIERDVAVLGGLVHLGERAVVEGDVISFGGSLQREEGSQIQGEVNSLESGAFPLIIPGKIQIPSFERAFPFIIPGSVRIPQMEVRFNPVIDAITFLLSSLLWALLALLVVLVMPNHAQRAARAAATQPAATGGLGCLTAVLAPFVLIILAITICGIPVSLLGVFLLVVAWAFGVIVIGLEVGTRLVKLLNRDWALPVSAALGTFLVTLVVNGVGEIPCIGWLVQAMVGVVGLGAVLLTRFGARAYPPELAPFPSAPATPFSPLPPETNAPLDQAAESEPPASKLD